MHKTILRLTLLAVVVVFAVTACGPKATPVATEVATAAPAGFTIPEIESGKFNVAVVLIGFHADGGWSQAHTEGAQWMTTQDPNIAVQYVELVNPGPDAESVMRSLARKGFDLILGTTFEYGPTMETLAAEFPNVNFLHLTGYRSNGTNYGNLMGAIEDMKYLAGMVAGARAKADGNTKMGYVAPWPLPEVIRLGNAFMLGVKVTCPECTMEVRWINTWYDPDKEKQAAQSLLDAGVDIILIGSDTPGPLVAAANAGKWAFTYDYINSCSPAPEKCLGTPYWNWGPVYLNAVKQIQAGTWKPGNDYLDADTGIVGFYGFMEGQTPQPGVPAEVIPLVQAKLAEMLAGTFTRFDIFKGPIKDNTGKVIVPAGQSLTQEDLEGIDAGTIAAFSLTDRTACTICMNWLVEGIQGTIPAMP
ncbi:MAG: BMP family ABC transporter substrate-binding protein [Candidatus Atribacteria bacterium]|nr:BMP family ABC transporter substrate-binding protein [Candidatus Atribacteria bacterium]